MSSDLEKFPIGDLAQAVNRALLMEGEIAFIVHGGATDFPVIDVECDRRFMVYKDGVAFIDREAATDYSAIEAYLLATLAAETGVVTTLPPGSGQIAGCYDFEALIARHNKRAKVQKGKPPPAYLKHDRTKQHKRTR